jgi:hypothetical protein
MTRLQGPFTEEEWVRELIVWRPDKRTWPLEESFRVRMVKRLIEEFDLEEDPLGSKKYSMLKPMLFSDFDERAYVVSGEVKKTMEEDKKQMDEERRASIESEKKRLRAAKK